MDAYVLQKQLRRDVLSPGRGAQLRRVGSGGAMGSWLSRAEGEAPLPRTPPPAKHASRGVDAASMAATEHLEGAPQPPIARALHRAAGSRRTTCVRPAHIRVSGGVPLVSSPRREGSASCMCYERHPCGPRLVVCCGLAMPRTYGRIAPWLPSSAPDPSHGGASAQTWPGVARSSPPELARSWRAPLAPPPAHLVPRTSLLPDAASDPSKGCDSHVAGPSGAIE